MPGADPGTFESRRIVGLIVVGFLAVASVVAGFMVHGSQRQAFLEAQQHEADRTAVQAERSAGLAVGQLDTAAAALSSGPLTRKRFHRVASTLLEQKALAGVSFTERIPVADRAAYEHNMGFPIRQPAGKPGQFARASARPVYYPTSLIESALKGRPTTFGVDIGANSDRMRTLQEAERTGEAAVTPITRLLRTGKPGLVVYRPVYTPGVPHSPTSLRGFISGGFRVNTLIGTALGGGPQSARVQLFVPSAASDPVSGPKVTLPDTAETSIRIADRSWLLKVSDPGRPSPLLPFLAALGGLILAGLLAVVLLHWTRSEKLARRMAERHLSRFRQADAARARSDRRYRLMAENSSDVIATYDRNGVFTYASPSSEEMFGWTPRELLGRSVFEFIHSDDLSAAQEMLSGMTADGQTLTYECRTRNRNGSYTWIEAVVQVNVDPETGQRSIQSSSRDIGSRKVLESELERLAQEDPLTGLHNRRRFEDDLRLAIADASRRGVPGALILIDIDNFKAINDSLGHVAGDDVIVRVGDILTRRLRDTDSICRLGGDEFAAILPSTSRADAVSVANSIRAEIAKVDPEVPRITVSVGVSDFAGAADSTESILTAADEALYAAKGAGRNLTRSSPPEMLVTKA